MSQETSPQYEVIMAGLGGMGVLMAGQVLSGAAFQQYKNVSWAPSYAVAKRGGVCECTVVFSDEEIDSPLLDVADSVMVFDSSQFKAFEIRVRSDGLMIVEKSGLQEAKGREDIRLLAVPGMEIAISKFGQAVINNLILLGTYVAVTKAVPVDLVMGELEKRYGAKKELLERNQGAFREGMELAKTLKEE